MVDKTVLPTSVLAPQICRTRSDGNSSPPTGVVRTAMNADASLPQLRGECSIERPQCGRQSKRMREALELVHLNWELLSSMPHPGHVQNPVRSREGGWSLDQGQGSHSDER